MAIHWRNGCRDLLIRAFDLYGQRLNGLKMAEFGNQKLKFDPNSGARRLQQAKPYFEFLGIRHVSFDLNNRSGALPWDLGKPLDPQALREASGIGMGEFDIVTNFGTSEHVVEGQEQCFTTAHELLRYGGLAVHAVPRVGTCSGHGAWKYTADWYREHAERFGYRTEYLVEWDKTEHWGEDRIKPGTQVYVLAILRKQWQRDTHSGHWVDPVRE